MQFVWLIPSVLFGAYLGVSTGAWHMLVMSLSSALVWLGIRRYNEAREIDLTEPVIFDGADVWIGDYQLPKREIFWKKQWHPSVYNAYLAKDKRPVFELPIDLETQSGHGLIIGPTGSGKSELLKSILKQTLQEQPNCELTLIDFKGGATFSPMAGLAQTKVFASDIDSHDPELLWQGIGAELVRRQLTLATKGVSRIEDLVSLGYSMPRHYIFIDELAAALAESPSANSVLTTVAARGRSLGMHLLAATQSAQGVPRAMLTNLRARIALADSDSIELAQLNMKRPLEPAVTIAGWAIGIMQKPGALSSYFNFPIGAKF